MRQTQWAGALLAGLFLVQAAGASWAKPLHFMVSGKPQDKVSFNSNAPVEVIDGATHDVDGHILFDDSFKFDAKHPFNINFAVDLNSIDTGIPLRNAHMRDNFLEAGKYPQATFKATGIKLAKKPDLKNAQTVNLVATGDFTLHGVTVKKTIPLTVDYRPALGKQPASTHITGKFPVPLAEHNIKRPEAVFMKLADTVYVTLNMTGTAQ